jgi:hypothetical protein
MSKTCFTIAEQKTNVINFIKKHKDILCLEYGRKAITAKFIGELVKTNNNDFFRLVKRVQLKFGRNFYIFTDDCDEKRRMIKIWLPDVLSKAASDKAIKDFCGRKGFRVVIETRCSWYNMTPKRWETFEAIFDFYDKPKKTAKTVNPSEVNKDNCDDQHRMSEFWVPTPISKSSSDEAIKKFEHLLNHGSCSDVYIDEKSECSAQTQIDNLINTCKLAKKEVDSFIELLENAKKLGCKECS